MLTYMALGDEEVKRHVRGWLLESPFVAFNAASKPSPFIVFAGRLAGKLLPHRQMVQKLDPSLLCRDEIVQQDFVNDDLCHDTGTLEGLAAMLDRAAGLDSGAIAVPADAGEGGKTRVWISHGTEDGVCDFKGSERIYKRWEHIEDKELVELTGWLHKCESRNLSVLFSSSLDHVMLIASVVHAEPSPDKESYIESAAKWILERSGPLDTLVRAKL